MRFVSHGGERRDFFGGLELSATGHYSFALINRSRYVFSLICNADLSMRPLGAGDKSGNFLAPSSFSARFIARAAKIQIQPPTTKQDLPPPTQRNCFDTRSHNDSPNRSANQPTAALHHGLSARGTSLRGIMRAGRNDAFEQR